MYEGHCVLVIDHIVISASGHFKVVIIMWYVSVHRSAGGEQSIDVSSLPGIDALNQPGMYRHTNTQRSQLS